MKLQELLRSREGGEGGPAQSGIVLNPRCLFNLLESNFLLTARDSDRPNYYRVRPLPRSSRAKSCGASAS